jgi:hypothetical protein
MRGNHGRSRKEWISTADRERLRLTPGQRIPGDNDVSLSETLEGILKDVKLADQHWLNQLRENWEAVAGDVSKHTVPGRMDGKCLYVLVDSSVWLTELSRYGGKALLAKVRRSGFSDQVSSIRFQINPG